MSARKTRRLLAGGNTVLSIIGAAVILVAINYLGLRHYDRSDWTSSGMYTLSDKSIKMLGTLEKDVEMYMMWSQGDPRFADVKELLDRYVGESSKIKLEMLDQDRNPERFKWVVQRFGEEGSLISEPSVVIVVSGDNARFVGASEFEKVQMDMFGQAPGHEEEVSEYLAEQAISSAILEVTSETQQKVCFTQGHEEWPLEGLGGKGLGHIKQGLIQDGYKVEPIATAGASRVPPDCNIVVVAGPRRAFLQEEASILSDYLKRGGRLLLLLDPVAQKDRLQVTGLEHVTAGAGIKLNRNVVLEMDLRRLVSQSPVIFYASSYANHDAVRHLVLPDNVDAALKEQIGAYPVVFSEARSLGVESSQGAVAEALTRTSSASFGETDISSLMSETGPQQDQYDEAGPVVIAAASILGGAQTREEAGHLVVVGDSDFLLEDFMLNGRLSNRDFWSGIIGWLSMRPDLISIAPKDTENVRLTMTEDDRWSVLRILIFEFLFFVLLGVFVYLRRRR